MATYQYQFRSSELAKRFQNTSPINLLKWPAELRRATLKAIIDLFDEPWLTRINPNGIYRECHGWDDLTNFKPFDDDNETISKSSSSPPCVLEDFRQMGDMLKTDLDELQFPLKRLYQLFPGEAEAFLQWLPRQEEKNLRRVRNVEVWADMNMGTHSTAGSLQAPSWMLVLLQRHYNFLRRLSRAPGLERVVFHLDIRCLTVGEVTDAGLAEIQSLLVQAFGRTLPRGLFVHVTNSMRLASSFTGW